MGFELLASPMSEFEERLIEALDPTRIPEASGTYTLELTEGDRIGAGRSWKSEFVFVGPGQPTWQAFDGPHCEFRPWTQLDSIEAGIELEDAALLLLSPPFAESEVFDAVVAVFRGLGVVAGRRPEALGPTIASLRLFLEGGLRRQISRDTEVGLLGELLVIAESPEPSRMAASWHTRASAIHDFSGPGERLEVKTTTGRDRVHHLREGQVQMIPGVCTSFVSLLAPEVEGGVTVSALVDEISLLLDEEGEAIFMAKVMDIAKCPPATVCAVAVDRVAARQSMWHVDPSSIPTPLRVPGVSFIEWTALIDREVLPPSSCAFLDLVPASSSRTSG